MNLAGKVAWGRRRVQRNRRRRGPRAPPPRRDRRDLRPPQGAAPGCCGREHARPPRGRHNAASVTAAAARIREELGPIDLAVLSAGYWKQMDPAAWDTDVLDRHIQVNLTGMSNSIAAVLPAMLERRRGTIAGIASVAGYRGLAGAEAYGATKAAQINLLESLRVHLARTGVQVTTVCPGLRADRPHGPQPLPHALHHRRRPGRTVHLRRPRTRAHRDRLPQADGPADEDHPPHPRRAWTALWARTSITGPAPTPATPPMTRKNRRMP